MFFEFLYSTKRTDPSSLNGVPLHLGQVEVLGNSRKMWLMERARLIALAVVAVILGIMAWSLRGERKAIETSVRELREKQQRVDEENRQLAERIEYFKIPENLLKESRAQFNYVLPGEKLIILVPEATSSAHSEQ
jgi:cell division protein FtsB